MCVCMCVSYVNITILVKVLETTWYYAQYSTLSLLFECQLLMLDLFFLQVSLCH